MRILFTFLSLNDLSLFLKTSIDTLKCRIVIRFFCTTVGYEQIPTIVRLQSDSVQP